MLFVFDADEPVAFWMKDTLVPLDMIFIAGDGRVRRVFANVPVVRTSLADDRIPRESGDVRDTSSNCRPAKRSRTASLRACNIELDGRAGGTVRPRCRNFLKSKRSFAGCDAASSARRLHAPTCAWLAWPLRRPA